MMEDKGGKGGRTRRTTAKVPGEKASGKIVVAKSSTAARPAAQARPATPKKAPAVRKAAVKTPIQTPASGGSDRAEMVRMAAFFRAERRGFAPGYEIEDWLAAEVEVAAGLGTVGGKPSAE
jgi:hypothetical protein